jgi:hypothetical protein
MGTPKISETMGVNIELGRRDAFHVPCVLVSSDWDLMPGSYLRFTDGKLKEVVSATNADRQAVADPFVVGVIPAGKMFWAFLEPTIVANLVHKFDVTIADIELPEAPGDEDDYDECAGCYN